LRCSTWEWAKIVARSSSTDCEIVGQQCVDLTGQRRRAVAVGDRLIIGDHDHHLDAEVL